MGALALSGLSPNIGQLINFKSMFPALAAFDVSELFSVVQAILAGLLQLLIQATSGIVEIFYTPGAEGGFTIYGTMLLFGLGLFFLMFAWRVIQGFIPRR